MESQPLPPPVAKIVPHSVTSHGQTRIDNYFWLRDRSDPDVIAYLEAENRYADECTKSTEALQQKLYQEILGRIRETDLSVPSRKGDYFYYARTEQGLQYPIYCRKYGSMDVQEDVLLDGNKLAEGKDYFRLGNFSVSPSQTLLAYSTENAGDETYTLVVKDLTTGALLPEEIPNTYYGLAWASDNRAFFYTTLDETKRPYRLYRHVLGMPVQEDVLVYEETDQKFILGVHKTRSEQFIVLSLSSHTASEARLLPADQPAGEWRTVQPRQPEVEYYIDHQGEYFYIRSNQEARNFRLLRTKLDQLEQSAWEEVIPHREAVLLEDVEGFANHLVLQEREEGLPKLRVFPSPNGELQRDQDFYLQFPEPVYTVAPGSNPEYHTRLLRYQYTSLVTPASVFDYDLETHVAELKKQTEVLGGYDASQYASERLFAAAPDGTRVPMSIVYRRDFSKDGTRPAFLYGYGSYGITIDPTFSSSRLSLLDRGFVYGIAHVRGGEDLGKQWHDDGKLLHKQNTFTDFVACAEKLIEDRFTSAGHIAIHGGSAGGLLIGAVLNLKPELFGCAIATVPFVDVLNTMEDPTLPLTVGEYDEWGNPGEPAYFEYIRSYSPYDNIAARAYPPLLVRAGLNDPRVSYWEPAKYVAKLRATKTDNHLLLLRTEMGAGHAGPSGRYDALRETAFDYAFVLFVMGQTDGEKQ